MTQTICIIKDEEELRDFDFVFVCGVSAMEGGADVSAFHDDPDEIASPVIEKSNNDPKQAFAMLRGKKKRRRLVLQGEGFIAPRKGQERRSRR